MHYVFSLPHAAATLSACCSIWRVTYLGGYTHLHMYTCHNAPPMPPPPYLHSVPYVGRLFGTVYKCAHVYMSQRSPHAAATLFALFPICGSPICHGIYMYICHHPPPWRRNSLCVLSRIWVTCLGRYIHLNMCIRHHAPPYRRHPLCVLSHIWTMYLGWYIHMNALIWFRRT